MKKLLLSLVLFLTLSFIGCNEGSIESAKKVETKEFSIEPANYEIVDVKDLSRKAFGKKSFNEYSILELKSLPTNKKILYKIVMSVGVKESQIKPTVEKIINQIKFDDGDIDEIILELYSENNLSNPSDIGSAIWAPFGDLGNIDANIAKNNIREDYNINFQIKQNLDEYLTQKLKSEIKFGYTEDERKLIFKDMVQAEDKADDYERLERNKILDKLLKENIKFDDKIKEQLKVQFGKIYKISENMKNEYKSKVLIKYKITEEQESEISREAFAENWPFE